MEMTVEQERALALARARRRRAQGEAPPELTPIDEGDWRGLGQRVGQAEAEFVGPVRTEEREILRQNEARRQGAAYGQSRGPAETGFRSFADNVSFGLPNLLEAATSGGDSGLSMAERHEFIKAADEGRAKANPKSGAAGMVGGIGAQAYLMMGIPAFARSPATVKEAAKIGGIVGGTTGAIDSAVRSRGDAVDTGMGTVLGTGLGAAGGAAVQKVAPKIGDAFDEAARWVGNKVAFVARSPEQNASRLVGQAFQGVDPVDAARFVNHPEGVILDAGGPAARDLFRGATNLSPEALERGQGFLNARAGREVSSLSDDVTRYVGGANSVAQSRQGIADAARANTSALYRQAAQEAPDVFDEGLGAFVNTPVGQATVKDAMARVQREYAARAVKGEKLVPPEMPFVTDELGNVTLKQGQTLGLEFWDAAKKSLDDMIESASRSGNKGAASQLTDIKRAIVAKLDAASPTYAKARGAAMEAFGAQDAVDLGAKSARVGGTDGRDITAALANMTPEQRLQYGQGMGADVVRQMQGAERVAVDSGTRSVVGSVMTPERERRLVEATTKPDDAKALTEAIEFWRRAAESRRSLGNSTTARQLATNAAIGSAPIAYSAASNQGAPDPTAVMIGMALAGGNAAKQARARAISEEIAKIMLAKGTIPSVAPAITSRIPPAARESLMRALMAGSALSAGQYAGQ